MSKTSSSKLGICPLDRRLFWRLLSRWLRSQGTAHCDKCNKNKSFQDSWSSNNWSLVDSVWKGMRHLTQRTAMNSSRAVVSWRLSQVGAMLRGKAGVDVLVGGGKGRIGGGGGGGRGKVELELLIAALAQISCVLSANKDKIFCWAKVGWKSGLGVKMLAPLTGLPLEPPLARLEFEPGDEALSPVGDLEAVEAWTIEGGGETEAAAAEVLVEVKEAMEKWAAAAAAAAGNKKGILGGWGGWCGVCSKWGWAWSGWWWWCTWLATLLLLLFALKWDWRGVPSFCSLGFRGPRSCWTASLFMAESKHFFSRHARHWFLWVLSIGQRPLKSPWALQVYTRFLWMLLLKKPEQPTKKSLFFQIKGQKLLKLLTYRHTSKFRNVCRNCDRRKLCKVYPIIGPLKKNIILRHPVDFDRTVYYLFPC